MDANAAFVDLCLAPDGQCTCRANLDAHGALPVQPESAPHPCWRVRVPWWSMSNMLLPLNAHEQLLRQDAGFQESHSASYNEVSLTVSQNDGASRGRNFSSHSGTRTRTPSPQSLVSEVPPPSLLLAPPVQVIRTLADIGSCLPDVVLGRRSRRHRGRNLTEGTADWETNSEATSNAEVSDWGASSSSSIRSRRRNAPIFVGTHLAWLESRDARCVCIVRKIHKLGFGAADILHEHFGQWGPVERVLLSNKPVEGVGPAPEPGTRKRPSGMGWIVMQNAEDAAKVLSHKHHQIGEIMIIVERFVSRQGEQKDDKIEEGLEEEEDEAACDQYVNMITAEKPAHRKLWSDSTD